MHRRQELFHHRCSFKIKAEDLGRNLGMTNLNYQMELLNDLKSLLFSSGMFIQISSLEFDIAEQKNSYCMYKPKNVFILNETGNTK